MMTEYFILQLRIIKRKFKDAGLSPLFGYIILIFLFFGFSFLLFYKIKYAAYIYILSALAITTQLAEIKRNDFLKLCFSNTEFKRIRIIENLIVVFPFSLFLIYKQFLLFACVLIVLAVLLAFVKYSISFNFTIPTPFYKKPFEFTVGFRNSFYLFFIGYIIAFIATFVDNFNLGIFAILLVFVVSLSYYLKPENEYYVWIYKLEAKRFLFEKIKIALLYSSFLILPVIIILEFAFYEKTGFIFAFLLAGYLFLIYIIVAKYSAYPNDVSLLQGFLFVLSIYFPLLLIVLIPYFFYQSKNSLNNLLK